MQSCLQDVQIILGIIRNTNTVWYATALHASSVVQNLKAALPRGMINGMLPVNTLGSGDCFFSAMSLAITGDEKLVSLFRLIALYIMVKYSDFFDNPGMR
jgi:hypothetical protein